MQAILNSCLNFSRTTVNGARSRVEECRESRRRRQSTVQGASCWRLLNILWIYRFPMRSSIFQVQGLLRGNLRRYWILKALQGQQCETRFLHFGTASFRAIWFAPSREKGLFVRVALLITCPQIRSMSFYFDSAPMSQLIQHVLQLDRIME